MNRNRLAFQQQTEMSEAFPPPVKRMYRKVRLKCLDQCCELKCLKTLSAFIFHATRIKNNYTWKSCTGRKENCYLSSTVPHRRKRGTKDFKKIDTKSCGGTRSVTICLRWPRKAKHNTNKTKHDGS